MHSYLSHGEFGSVEARADLGALDRLIVQRAGHASGAVEEAARLRVLDRTNGERQRR